MTLRENVKIQAFLYRRRSWIWRFDTFTHTLRRSIHDDFIRANRNIIHSCNCAASKANAFDPHYWRPSFLYRCHENFDWIRDKGKRKIQKWSDPILFNGRNSQPIDSM